MKDKRSHSRSSASRRVAWVALSFALAATFAVLQGCGPAVPKEELGEILTEVPTEFYFESPYPVPWAIESDESDTEAEDFHLAEGVGQEQPTDSSIRSGESQREQLNSGFTPEQTPDVEGKTSQ